MDGDTKKKDESREHDQSMIDHELAPCVVEEVDKLYSIGKLSNEDLDKRAIEALRQLSIEAAIKTLKKFSLNNLDHVSNRSAYLCSIIKANRNKDGKKRFPSPSSNFKVGPDEGKLADILSRTGYTLDVSSGQRKYGGPSPGWIGPPPGKGCELYCGNLPRDTYEDVLIPLFEECGKIWEIRLMMDGSMTGLNRGYAFVTLTSPDDALKAVENLDAFEIAPGKHLIVNVSVSNTRLFVGNIPKSKSKEEIADEFAKFGSGLVEVIIYATNEMDAKKLNRGFCFLEYSTHQLASHAKRRLTSGMARVWGCDVIVDWADPQEEPDQDIMNKVKILYCRNLVVSMTEEMLGGVFQRFGKVERVKKIKDYAFVHFEKREDAIKAMEKLNGEHLFGSKLEVTLAKPPSDKKKKEEMLRRREQRMMESMAKCLTYPTYPDYIGYCDDYHLDTPRERNVYEGVYWPATANDENLSNGRDVEFSRRCYERRGGNLTGNSFNSGYPWGQPRGRVVSQEGTRGKGYWTRGKASDN